MYPDSERTSRFASPPSSSPKRLFAFYVSFLVASLLLLLGSSFFSYRYQVLHQPSLKMSRQAIVSLSESVKRTPSVPLRSVLPDFSSVHEESGLYRETSVVLKALGSFRLTSLDYVLAQIGAPAVPKAFYHSSESLCTLLTRVLDHLVPENYQDFDVNPPYPHQEKLVSLPFVFQDPLES